MTRFIMPAILIAVAVTVFFLFTSPIYGQITQLRAQSASYDGALDNSKALENERDKLTAKYNSINPDSLARLVKLLPENIDNIRLILEIEKIASPYGMGLKDIKYSATATNTPKVAQTGALQAGVANQPPNKEYGVWDLEFSTTGTYNNFLNFTRDLENNLRIVDISSVQFSSEVGGSLGAVSSGSYKYDFKIKTYWLKN